MNRVVLVNKKDEEVGVMGKTEAHQGDGVLHRAISVQIYRDRNGKKELLLQKRSKNKPLWPHFWCDTVSTHPRKGESYVDCALRRLKEEMGIDTKAIDLVFKLYYQAKYNSDLSEHEVDGILVGEWDGEPVKDEYEVEEFGWVEIDKLRKDLQKNKDKYAPWFLLMMKDKRLNKQFSN